MREILFRGKTKGGEWIYGYYLGVIAFPNSIAQNCIVESKLHYDYQLKKGVQEIYTVIPETVGQFTGLRDKNGKKIFEGDIVRFSHEAYDEDFIGAVIFDECESGFILKNGDGWNGISYIGECYEVIGNIHDNPELLEG